MNNLQNWLGLNKSFPQKGGWGPFLIAVTIGALLIAIAVSSWFNNRLGPLIENVKMVATEVYPDDLEIVVYDGILSTNYDESFVLTGPDVDAALERSGLDAYGEWANELPTTRLLIIDDSQDYTREAFRSSDAMIVMFRDGVVFDRGNGRNEFMPYDGNGEAPVDKAETRAEADSITESDLVEFLDDGKFDKVISVVKPFVFAGSLFFGWVHLFLKIVTMLILVLIAQLFVSRKERRVRFEDIFQKALRWSFLPIILAAAMWIIKIPGMRWLFAILMIAALAIGLSQVVLPEKATGEVTE